MAEGFDKVRMIKVLNQAQLEKFVKDGELEKISEYMEQNAIQCMEGRCTPFSPPMWPLHSLSQSS